MMRLGSTSAGNQFEAQDRQVWYGLDAEDKASVVRRS